MALTEDWVETDPDGAVITVSQLDDYQRQAKRAIRERLEGDPANPLTGIFEVGSFAAAPMPRAGSARVYSGTDAAIQALAAGYRQDGRLGYATDTKRLYHVGAGAVVEVGYMRTTGPNTQTQASSRDPSFLVRDSAATALAANALFAGNGTQLVTQSHDSNARFAAVSFAGQSQFIGYRANGNSGAITGVINGSTLVSFEGRGYTSAAAWTQGGAGGMQVVGTEAWSAVANGAKVILLVTANGATANTIALTIGQDATATFASSVTATSFVGNVTGSAATLNPGRTINGVAFDGSANITVTASTVGTLTFGTHLTGTSFTGANNTIATDATNLNTVSTLVARDASGNFVAGTITAALSGNATTATTLATTRTIWGQNFNGSANVTGAITYGGVTLSNAVTGTGNMVLSAGPTFTGTAAFALITSSSTINGQTISATASFTGTVSITSTLGVTGTATVGALTTSGASTLAAVTSTTLAINGASITGAQFSVSVDSSVNDAMKFLDTRVGHTREWRMGPGTGTLDCFGIYDVTAGALRFEIPSTGGFATQPAGAFNPLIVANSSTYVVISMNNSIATASLLGIFGGAAGDNNLYHQAPSSGAHWFRINTLTAVTIDSSIMTLGGINFTIASGSKLLIDGNGDTYIIETSANVMDHFCGGTKSLSLTATNAAFINTISTAAPATTSGAWKLGQARAGAGSGTNTLIQVSVDGTTYDINAHT